MVHPPSMIDSYVSPGDTHKYYRIKGRFMLILRRASLAESGNIISEMLRTLRFRPKQGSTILIKPNLCAIHPRSHGEITDPLITEAVVRFLLGYGCRVIIGETDKLGPADKDYTFWDVIRNSGYAYLDAIDGVRIVNLDQDTFVTRRAGNVSIRIPKTLHDADHYINIPKMKTHWQTQVTIGLKNQMGVIDENARMHFHRDGLDKHIAHLARVLRPDLTIVDGIIAMQGQGPHWGKAVRMGIIVGGDDILEVDTCCCALMGIDPNDVKHLLSAWKHKVGSWCSDTTLIESHRHPLTHAVEKPLRKGDICVWQQDGHGCSGCGRAIEQITHSRNPLRLLKLLRSLLLKKTHFVLGRVSREDELTHKLDGRTICVGDCTKAFAQKHGHKFVPGCPPTSQKVAKRFYTES